MTKIVSRTVEVCIFRLEGDLPKYLLLKRSAGDHLYPGIWQFVTGTMNEGETAVEAALREVSEETGLAMQQFWVAPFVSSFYVGSNDSIHMSPFFVAQVAQEDKVRLSSEHQEYQWCTFEVAHEKLVWPAQLQGLQIVRDHIVGKREASRLLSVSV